VCVCVRVCHANPSIYPSPSLSVVMSRFVENVVNLFWEVGGGFIDRLKAISSYLVEDDEYVLIFVLFLGVPAIIVMWLIARVIRRTHNRVRYASEYVEQNPDAFVTSSSSSSSSSSDDDDINNATGNSNRARRSKQYTMEEVYSAAQKLTQQETLRRRAARRAEAEAAAAAAAASAETSETAATLSAATAEESERKTIDA
jgi:hypothetical protein